MICDLHTHSIYSDGTCTPQEIIDQAVAAGLSAIALTDHSTIDGLYDFIAAAEQSNIEIALGTEFSVDYCGKEMHLIGLFIGLEHFSQISDMVKEVIECKERSNIELVDALVKAGFDIDYDEIRATTADGKMNRAHIATALFKKGYVSSVQDAFKFHLSKNGPYYKEPKRLDAFEVIEFIKSIGAVSVLAHPFLNLSKEELLDFLPLAKEKGLDGMECYYSLYDEETTSLSLQIADEFRLLPSGGSDFHGERKPDIMIGVGKGSLNVPYECYLALRKRAKEI